MIDFIRKFFELLGMCTLWVVIYFIVRLWWEKWGQFWFKYHKHSYQVHHIWRYHDIERGCDYWELCLRCEKCGKEKACSFWNDKIKLKVDYDDEQED